MDLHSARIAIVGLGYVGLPLAVEFGKLRPVVGFDINNHRIAELQDGRDGALEVAPLKRTKVSPFQQSTQYTKVRSSHCYGGETVRSAQWH